jgi:hypothetical protein
MSIRKLFPLCALFIAGIFTGAVLSAPAPKDKKEPKAPAQEEEVEPGPALGISVPANRAKSMNNLKQIALAFHNYASTFNDALPQNITDKDGKPLLSWRVHLLPFIEEVQLYKEFKLDEAWDSENNIKLLEKMPKTYESPRVKVKTKGYTVYQGFEGNGAIFGSIYKIGNIPDGTSNTIMVVETSVAVPWTKPVNIPFDPKKDLPDIGKAYGNRPLAAMCDGSVRILDLKKIKPETLKNAINSADGNTLGDDWK